MSKNIECKFEHFGITVTNLEKSIDFYRKNFGFKEIKKAKNPDLELKLATLQLGDFYLELVQLYATEKQEKKQKPKQEKDLSKVLQENPSHLAINTNNIIDIYNRLMENKVEFAIYFNFMKSKSFFCYDLDGFLIEVRQR